MMRKCVIAAAMTAAMATLAGCATPAVIQPMASPVPRFIPAGTTVKPVQFRRLVVQFERGRHLGEIRAGFLCVPRTSFTYTGGRDINDSEYAETFRKELTQANYAVTGSPTDLFDDPADTSAELVVAGAITDLKINSCVIPGGETKGESSITIEWQIYNRLERRVVHKVTTRGTGRTDHAAAGGAGLAVQAAFAMATRGLLADETFHRLVTGTVAPPAQTQEAEAPAFELTPRERFSGRIAERMAEVQNAVVTVLTTRGHGSGFFISADGYVLTNQHVVGNTRQVRIKLATGREVPGEVVAGNRRRDVALIRTQETGFTPLPLAAAEPGIGSDVYALGSPFTQHLAATVTRGIVSGYRSIDGMRYLQSDVNIQGGNSGGPLTDEAGNVVGLAVATLNTRGVAVGLNFFVPIEDALSSVSIERAASAAATAGRSRMVQVRRAAPAQPPAKVAAPAPAPAPSPPQVAAAAPVAASPNAALDGTYRATVTQTMFPELRDFELTINVRGATVTGHGDAREIADRVNSFSFYACRVQGHVEHDGDAELALDCASVAGLKIAKMSGRFAPDPAAGNAVTARMQFRTSEGHTGEILLIR